VRAAADAAGVPLFINARTDVFLAAGRDAHAGRVDAALARGAAYAAAGADGLFVPGLVSPELIAAVCAQATLPVNVMFQTGMPSVAALARLGVARISHGPRPFRQTMAALAARSAEETASGA
jgi:2-methylisocitrate lyase-like PEP mutase family enzyme